MARATQRWIDAERVRNCFPRPRSAGAVVELNSDRAPFRLLLNPSSTETRWEQDLQRSASSLSLLTPLLQGQNSGVRKHFP